MTKNIPRKYLIEICKAGQGAACCKYPVAGADGITCMKDNPENKKVIDDNWAIHEHVAQSDNCDGYITEQNKITK